MYTLTSRANVNNILYKKGAAIVLERGGRARISMTPAEMSVLFSAHVLAFVFIWFTGMAEGGNATRERPCKSAESTAIFPEMKERLERSGHQHELIWNVAAFFGLKQ